MHGFFSGFNLQKNAYIPFNKAIRKLILTQGEDGEELLKILDHIETYGDQKFTSANLRALADLYHKAYEYARAVNVALLNWIEGAAQGLVEHGFFFFRPQPLFGGHRGAVFVDTAVTGAIVCTEAGARQRLGPWCYVRQCPVRMAPSGSP